MTDRSQGLCEFPIDRGFTGYQFRYLQETVSYGTVHLIMDGQKLRTLRIWMGLSQQELADKLGVTRSTIGRWECGLRAISEPMKRFILKVCDEETTIKAEKLVAS